MPTAMVATAMKRSRQTVTLEKLIEIGKANLAEPNATW